MEHTVEAYLDRQPTEKLVQFLKDYQEGKITESYEHMLSYIVAALEKRKDHAVPEEPSPPLAQKSS